MKISPISHYAYLAGVLAIAGLTPLSADSLTVLPSTGPDYYSPLLTDRYVSNGETTGVDAQVYGQYVGTLLETGSVNLSPSGNLNIDSFIFGATLPSGSPYSGGLLTLNPTGDLLWNHNGFVGGSLSASAGGNIVMQSTADVVTIWNQVWNQDVTVQKTVGSSGWRAGSILSGVTFTGNLTGLADTNGDEASLTFDGQYGASGRPRSPSVSVAGQVSGFSSLSFNGDSVTLNGVTASTGAIHLSGKTYGAGLTDVHLGGNYSASSIYIKNDTAINLTSNVEMAATATDIEIWGEFQGNGYDLSLTAAEDISVRGDVEGVNDFTIDADGSIILQGIVADTFTKNGTGSPQISGAVTINSAATFNGGLTRFNGGLSYGAGATVSLNNGASIQTDVSGFNATLANLSPGANGLLQFTGENTSDVVVTSENLYIGGSSQLGEIHAASDTVRLSAITLGKAAEFVNGAIENPAIKNQVTGTDKLVANGGSITFKADQDYSGSTTITAGTGMVLWGASAVNTPTVTIGDGGYAVLLDGGSFSSATDVFVNNGAFDVSGSFWGEGVLQSSTNVSLDGGQFTATPTQMEAALNNGQIAVTGSSQKSYLILGGGNPITASNHLDLSLVTGGDVYLGVRGGIGQQTHLQDGFTLTPQGTTYRIGDTSTNGHLFVNGVNIFNGARDLIVDNNGLGYDAPELIIRADQNFSGGTSLVSGSVRVDTDGALGSGDVQMASGTQLSFGGTGALTFANNLVVQDGAILGRAHSSPADATLTGSITQSVSDTLYLETHADAVMTLSGDNSGALGSFVITEGNVAFGNSASLPNSVKLGGKLIGSGAVLSTAVSKLTSDSGGSILLNADSTEAIDFATLPAAISLGSYSDTPGTAINYSGNLGANTTYRLGGNVGNSVLRFTGANQLTGTSNLMVSGNAKIEIAAAQDFDGGSTIGSGSSLVAAADGAFGSGSVELGSGSSVGLNTADPFSGVSKAITYSGSLTGGDVVVGHVSALSNVNLSGSLNALELAVAGALTPGSYDLNSMGSASFEKLTLSATGAILASSTITSNAVELNALTAIDDSIVTTGSLILNTTDAALDTVFSGVSDVHFNAANTLAGSSSVNGVDLKVHGSGDHLNSSAATTTGRGTIKLSAAPTSGTLDLTAFVGDFNLQSNGHTVDSIQLGVGADYILDDVTLNTADALSGDHDLTVTGSTKLSNDQSYTGGTTIESGGTLQVNGSVATSGVDVQDGGTLKGSGSIAGAVVVADGGTLAPGNSPGVLTLEAGATFESGSTFSLEVAGTTNGDYDKILIGADLTFEAGSIIDITEYGSFAFEDNTEYVFDIVDVLPAETASIADLGLVFTNSDGSLINFDTVTQSFDDTTGALTMTIGTPAAVPEPSSAALLALGALAAVGRRKRKNA